MQLESTSRENSNTVYFSLVNCHWASWESWQRCTVTCGGGKKRRTRKRHIIAQNGGLDCPGVHEESQDCGNESCPVAAVNCQWSKWTKQGKCSTTCGNGTQQWFRYKLQEEKHGGLPCSGDSIFQTECSGIPCPLPVDCKWSTWSNWSSCSKTCGNGLQERKRTKPTRAENGGKECIGNNNETRSCNEGFCTGKKCIKMITVPRSEGLEEIFEFVTNCSSEIGS